MSTVSLQDSQQFYDAIEYLTSDSDSDDDSDQESDQEPTEMAKKDHHPFVPGFYFIFKMLLSLTFHFIFGNYFKTKKNFIIRIFVLS